MGTTDELTILHRFDSCPDYKKQMNMSNKIKCYVNGKEEKAGEFTKAKEVLIRKGLCTGREFESHRDHKYSQVAKLDASVQIRLTQSGVLY